MDAQERRQAVARRLEGGQRAGERRRLAREHSVSRQIIVGDIALLRAGGLDIAATPRGYMIQRSPPVWCGTVAVRHRPRRWKLNSTPWWTRAAPFWT
ncbi:MAG: HTH domain-containing protein [Lawsonibacter sp.]